jgi:hypothetical protein
MDLANRIAESPKRIRIAKSTRLMDLANRSGKWICQIDQASGFAKSIRRIDLANRSGKGKSPKSNCPKKNRQIESPNRIADTKSNSNRQFDPAKANSNRQIDPPNGFGKSIRRSCNTSIWQIDPACLQHINRLQLKFAIQIGLLTASI